MTVETFNTARYQLDIHFADKVEKIVLTDRYSGVTFADSEYRYSAFVESEDGIVRLDGLYDPELREEVSERGGTLIVIAGRLGEHRPDLRVRHRFYIPDNEDCLEDRIVLQNNSGSPVIIHGYRFAFRKRLEKPTRYGGPGIDIENYRLIALPFRLQPDGKKHDYTLDDIYNRRYQCSVSQNPTWLSGEVVDAASGRSEGWAWTDGENGLLVIKYNPNMIEYSMLQTEEMDGQVYLNFGGAAPCLYTEPYEARNLESGKQITFGVNRYQFYEGLWARGSYLFREYMRSQGHGLPDDYDPPVTWNEVYNIGWHHNDPEKLAGRFTAETLENEARKARDIGCEALYIGPGWEVCEGSTVWDKARLGEAEEFVRKIKVEYGLKVGFRTVGRSYCDDYPGLYRRTFDNATGYYAPYRTKPFYEPCCCAAGYQQEKLKRIVKVADAGMDFITFDEFDWRGMCFDTSHGHPVPTTPSQHAKAVVELVRKVHEKHPGIIIELHDPVWPSGVKYLPLYYLHDMGSSFDEHPAFDFMRNPLECLLSGRALSLFYYNLAYDIPLHLDLDMDRDNDNCLAFWYYASTVRHLGIGGGNGSARRSQAYKEALTEYKSLKELYTQGEFYGIDELTHIHVLPELGRCVLNSFNLTDTPMSREVEVRLNDLGLIEDVAVHGAPHEVVGGKLVLKLEIPPFSPMLVKMFAE